MRQIINGGDDINSGGDAARQQSTALLLGGVAETLREAAVDGAAQTRRGTLNARHPWQHEHRRRKASK